MITITKMMMTKTPMMVPMRPLFMVPPFFAITTSSAGGLGSVCDRHAFLLVQVSAFTL